MSKRAIRKTEHRKQACQDVGLKPAFDGGGELTTTWGDINKAKTNAEAGQKKARAL